MTQPDLLAAAKAFLDKVEECVNSQSYSSMIFMAHAHGWVHDGPDWVKERDDLRAAAAREEELRSVSVTERATWIQRIAALEAELAKARDRIGILQGEAAMAREWAIRDAIAVVESMEDEPWTRGICHATDALRKLRGPDAPQQGGRS